MGIVQLVAHEAGESILCREDVVMFCADLSFPFLHFQSSVGRALQADVRTLVAYIRLAVGHLLLNI